MPAASTLKEYLARVDAKKRVTIRGVNCPFYRVSHRKDGSILLKPREMEERAPVDEETLRCIGSSIASMKAGKRSKPVDLKKLAAMRL